jgi:hypothetical protein
VQDSRIRTMECIGERLRHNRPRMESVIASAPSPGGTDERFGSISGPTRALPEM